MKTGLITGASRGFGYALAEQLVAQGWRLIVDGRDEGALVVATSRLGDAVIAIPGDVADPSHRRRLIEAVDRHDGLHLLVNNASSLGATPLPPLDRYPLHELRRVLEVNVLAPLALMQSLTTNLKDVGGTVVNISSDAAVEAYEGWGGYGASKAALDQLSAVFATEQGLRVLSFDPGDMRTQMHQAAYPGEDISDRPPPETVVPSLIRLLEGDEPSGRYRSSELQPVAAEVRS